MHRWTSLGLLVCLTGCSNQTTLLPQGHRTMLEIYTDPDGAGAPSLIRAVQRPVDVAAPTSAAAESLKAWPVFERLPNPDLHLYVFPHRATADGVPIPGYTTVFPLYKRVEYALPGERP